MTNKKKLTERPKTPLKAIRWFCIECSGDQPKEVKWCSSRDCALWEFRFGKNPNRAKTLTDEQRAAIRERLLKHKTEE